MAQQDSVTGVGSKFPSLTAGEGFILGVFGAAQFGENYSGVNSVPRAQQNIHKSS